MEPRKRFGGVGRIAIVLVLLAGAGVGAYALKQSGNDDPDGPFTLEQWADGYCDAFEPYTKDGEQLLAEITGSLGSGGITAPGGVDRLASSITDFGELAQRFLGDLENLATDHPIEGSGGDALTENLRAGITTARSTVDATVEAFGQLDPTAADYPTRVLAAMGTTGVSLDTRITVTPTPALTTLNSSINASPNCESVFEPGTPVAVAGGAPAAAACEIELATLRTAVQAYTALNGGPPPNEDALVPDFLDAPSSKYDLVVEGDSVKILQQDPGCPAP